MNDTGWPPHLLRLAAIIVPALRDHYEREAAMTAEKKAG